MRKSNCCDASVSYVEDNGLAVCNSCKEHCEWYDDEKRVGTRPLYIMDADDENELVM